MIQQVEFALAAKHRGCHLVTREIIDRLPKPLPKAGLLNLFVKHTSCALSINENADPDVRTDMEKILNMNLGTWQGIYLCEFRNYGGPRKIVATIYG